MRLKRRILRSMHGATITKMKKSSSKECEWRKVRVESERSQASSSKKGRYSCRQ